jgi:D-alanyl-lipoteichoic acid acyltransferase DltB (MBOAT superfamily)
VPAQQAGAAGAPARRVSPREVAGLLFIAAQVGLCLLVAREFELEHPGFWRIVLPLSLGGFLVHHWLPRRVQPWFFTALSLVGIERVFGVADGAWLVGAGLLLIALCHAPVAFRWRLLLVLAAAAVLVAMRSEWIASPWSRPVWPILGSMFMFRLGVYLYDLKHHGATSPGLVLPYFFMLPNAVFVLFPVIDFQTFRRTWFDRPALDIYAEGVRWIFRGLTHLLLYRLVYRYVAISPADVTSTAGIVQYLVGNYGLYLRVSGQFHVIVGLLHLFGFRLPESHRFFYLASSFSDLWRRINIYWKDFMQKLVYLPVFFALKRRSETTKLVLATLAVIGVTWFLHSYQWFWLLGTWLFSWTDAAFWGLMGVFLVASTLLEQRRGRVRQLTARSPRAGASWRLPLQTAGMFALMALLWGLWTSPTFTDFVLILRTATLRAVDVAFVLGVLGVVALAAFVSQRFSLGAPTALAAKARWQQHPLLVGALPLGLFWLAGHPDAEGRVPDLLHAVAREVRTEQLNTYDAAQLQRGYYEEIVGINRFNGELWELYSRSERKDQPELVHEGLGGFQDDGFGNRCFLPHVDTMFKGGRLMTNRWGLRDRDYEKAKPASTWRIAVLGPSYVMGSGVNNGEPFEQVLEDRLNAEWFPRAGLRYELLNFGLPQASPAEVAAIIGSGRAAEFQPDVVLVVVNRSAPVSITNDLWRRVKFGQPLPAFLGEILPGVAVGEVATETELERLLAPHVNALLRWALHASVDATRAMGALPVLALIPMPHEPADFSGKAGLLEQAAEAGFAVIDMQDAFEGHAPEGLTISNADYHPNAVGHRILAARLYTELAAHPGTLEPAR